MSKNIFDSFKTTTRQREFEKCIKRLFEASDKEWETFEAAVQTERDLVDKYPVPVISDGRFSFTKRDVDRTAAVLLPDEYQHLVPIQSIGDGSCLYNSVSTAFVGDSRYACEFRVRVALEFVEHFLDYEQLGRSITYAGDFNRNVVRETVDCSIFSGILHMVALTNSLNVNMLSVYPNVNKRLRADYNRLLTSHRSSQSAQNNAHVRIFWTRTNLWGNDPYWQPNHFVPLFLPEEAGVNPPKVDRSQWNILVTERQSNLPSCSNVIDLTADDVSTCAKCYSPLDHTAAVNHMCTKCPGCNVFLTQEYLSQHLEKHHPEILQKVENTQLIKAKSSKPGLKYYKCVVQDCNALVRQKKKSTTLVRGHTCKKTISLSRGSKDFLVDCFGERKFDDFSGDASASFLRGPEWPNMNYKSTGWTHIHLRRCNKNLTWNYRKCKSTKCTASLNFICFHMDCVKVIVQKGSHSKDCDTANMSDKMQRVPTHSPPTTNPNTFTYDRIESDDEVVYPADLILPDLLCDSPRTSPGVPVSITSGDNVSTCGFTDQDVISTSNIKCESSSSEISSDSPLPPSTTANTDTITFNYITSDEEIDEAGNLILPDLHCDSPPSPPIVPDKITLGDTTSIGEIRDQDKDGSSNVNSNSPHSPAPTNSNPRFLYNAATSVCPPRNWGKKEAMRKCQYRRRCKGCYQCKQCKTKASSKSRCLRCGFRDSLNIKCSAILKVEGQADSKNLYTEIGIHDCNFFTSDENVDVQSRTKELCLPNDGKKLFDYLNDGRRWGRYVTIQSDSRGSKCRRYCGGMHVCENSSCPFLLKAQTKNIFHFSETNSSVVCDVCGNAARKSDCPAFIEINVEKSGDRESVKLLNGGEHACEPRPRFDITEKSDVEKIFELFPRIGASTAIKVAMNNIMQKYIVSPTDKIATELQEAASGLIDNRRVSKLKTHVRARLNLTKSSNSFEAVELFSERTRQIDKYFVYQIEQNKYVFTTSTQKLELAAEISQAQIGSSDGYVHIDFQASRVKGMSCLGMNIYYPFLRQTVNLCKSYSFHEDTDSVVFALKMMQRAVGDKFKGNVSFQPEGWMADEAGSIHQGLKIVYGESVSDKTVTCQAHFMSSVTRNTKKAIGDEKSISDYKKISRKMMSAVTVTEYKKSVEEMESFIRESSNRQQLKNWLVWWHDRRSHWADAFRVKDAPSTNLSEVFHAKEWFRGSTGLPLIDAVYDDACDSMLLKAKLDSFLHGAYKGGSGPAIYQVAARKGIKQEFRAIHYGANIESQAENGQRDSKADTYRAFQDCPIDVESTHRDDKKVQRTPRSPLKRPRPPCTLSGSTESMDFGESKNEPGFKCRRRLKHSSEFKLTLQKVKNECHLYTISEDLDISNQTSRGFKVEHRYSFDRSYTVILRRHPSCNCMYFRLKSQSKKIDTCKHIAMTLLCLGFEVTDRIINQVTYTEQEIHLIISNAFSQKNLRDKMSRYSREQSKSYEEIQDYIPFLEKYSHWRGRRSECVICHQPLQNGLVISMNGRYRSGTFTRKHRFRYCLDPVCFEKVPSHCTVETFSRCVRGDCVSPEEINLARDAGLDIA